MKDLSPLHVTLSKRIGKGANSACYTIKENNKEVVIILNNQWAKGEVNQNQLRDYKEQVVIEKQLPSHTRLARTKKIGSIKIGNKDYVGLLQEKASGKEIHQQKEDYTTWKENITILVQAPQKHYNKLIETQIELNKVGLNIDPSKPTNFFYDSEEGFTIIDIGASLGERQSFKVPFIHTTLLNYFAEKIKQDDQTRQKINTVLEKLNKAGDKGKNPLTTFGL